MSGSSETSAQEESHFKKTLSFYYKILICVKTKLTTKSKIQPSQMTHQ